MTNYTLLGDGGHEAGSQTYSGNYYTNVGLGRCAMIGSSFTTEAYFSQIIRAPGTVSYLSWGLDSTFANTLTLTLNKNSSSTGLAISIPASTTGWVTDSSDSVAVSSGDVLDFSVNAGTNASSYNGSFYCTSARLDALTDTMASVQMLATVGPTTILPSSQPKFFNFLGILGGDPTEDNQKFYCLTAGTWRNMACHVGSNTFLGTIAATLVSRKNGGNGAMAISISGMTTGYFEDTTAPFDSVSSGDLLDYRFSTTATLGSLIMDWIGAHFVATNTGECMIGGTPGVGSAIDAGATYYSSLFGGGNREAMDTTRATGLIPYALSASKFTTHITDAPGGGTATFTLLKNGAASGLAISSSGTGYFMISDIDNVDFAQGDTCANQIVGGTSGSVTWAGTALLLTASA